MNNYNQQANRSADNRLFSTASIFVYAIVATVLTVGLASVGYGQDDTGAPTQDPPAAEEQLSKTANELGSTFSRALKGDQEALTALAVKFLVPAAIALIILIIGYMVASFIGRVLGGIIAKRVDETLGKFFAKMIKTLIMIMVLLGVLGFFGVDVTSFAAILAAAGFAVGMALQGTLSNFAAGVMLLVFRPYKVGDFINAAGTSGTVDEIDLFTTRLNTADNRHLIVPNSAIFGSTIENATYHDTRRVDVAVGVAYDANIPRTREVLLSAVENVAGILPDPAPNVVLTGLGGSSVDWQLRVWSVTGDYWGVKERLTEAIKDKLDAAKIGIPYPTMDINVTNT